MQMGNELSPVGGQSQDAFEERLTALAREGSASEFSQMLEKYPDLAEAFTERLEMYEKGLKDDGLPEYTEERKRAQWERLCCSIREKFGAGAI